MNSENIRVKINPKSMETTYEASGITGTSCEDVLGQLTHGQEKLAEGHTEEYYIPVPVPEFINEGD